MTRRGFTLVELLVVVAIIVALLAILLPALNRSIEAAQTAVCASNTRQWASMHMMYASENYRSFVPQDDGNPGSDWTSLLSRYTDDDETRTCPTASEPIGISFSVVAGTGQYGGTYNRWDLDFGTPEQHAYGSYGINTWISDVSATVSLWRGAATRGWHYQNVTGVVSASNTPIVGDSAWLNGNPFDYDSATDMGRVPPTATWNEQNAALPQWFWDMGRHVLKRHHGGINMAFVDGSARRLELSELWALSWHKEFREAGDVVVPY